MLSELQRLKVAGSSPAGSHREMRRSSTAERGYVSIEIVVPVSVIESYGGRRECRSKLHLLRVRIPAVVQMTVQLVGEAKNVPIRIVVPVAVAENRVLTT
jgi:hypothetical protein